MNCKHFKFRAVKKKGYCPELVPGCKTTVSARNLKFSALACQLHLFFGENVAKKLCPNLYFAKKGCSHPDVFPE